MKYLLISSLLLIGTASHAQRVLASAELEAQNISEVRVEGSFCDVIVEKGDKNYMVASIMGKGEEGDFRFDTQTIGSTLVIKVVRKAKQSWKGYNLRESKIELTLKDGVKVDINNSSGDVFISDLNTDESKIEATSGDITLKRIKANVEVESSSGDISIDELVGSLDMESTSGDQRLFDVKGSIDTRASSGDITISNFDGEVELEATSGDVSLRGGVGSLKVRTTSGDIEGTSIELSGNAYFKSSSGDVEIDFVNDVSSLSFDLTASSGNLNVGSKSGEKKLYIDRGGYKIVGVTSSGNQGYD